MCLRIPPTLLQSILRRNRDGWLVISTEPLNLTNRWSCAKRFMVCWLCWVIPMRTLLAIRPRDAPPCTMQKNWTKAWRWWPWNPIWPCPTVRRCFTIPSKRIQNLEQCMDKFLTVNWTAMGKSIIWSCRITTLTALFVWLLARISKRFCPSASKTQPISSMAK